MRILTKLREFSIIVMQPYTREGVMDFTFDEPSNDYIPIRFSSFDDVDEVKVLEEGESFPTRNSDGGFNRTPRFRTVRIDEIGQISKASCG